MTPLAFSRGIEEMKRFFTATAMAVAALALQGAIKSARVDFTSVPEGAQVYVDGVLRGLTPLIVYDLASGEHHAKFALKDYEQYDDIWRLEPNIPYMVRHANLVSQKGLLLLTSEPEGCEITLDGLSLGRTPRLITSLDVKNERGAYRFLLQKTGYQSKMVEVRFNGRTPLVRHESLVLDSGTLRIVSVPEGATVELNGIRRGVTPLEVKDIPKGRTSVTLTKAGFKPLTREISLKAGDSTELSVELEGEKGSLMLTSVPEGARFYIDGEAQGKGPLTLGAIKSGRYKVKAEMEGYGSLEKEIFIPLGGRVSEEFRLENVRGRIELKTSPAGAQVFLDGHAVGVSKASSPDAEFSDLMIIGNVDAGEHTITVKKNGFAEQIRRPVVENSRTSPLNIRLKRVFKPNIEIVTNTGVYRGVFVESNPQAITLEVSLGITRSFPREDVRETKFLTDE